MFILHGDWRFLKIFDTIYFYHLLGSSFAHDTTPCGTLKGASFIPSSSRKHQNNGTLCDFFFICGMGFAGYGVAFFVSSSRTKQRVH
jgi:hypothetical protein